MDHRQDVSDRFSTVSTVGTFGTVGFETLVLSEPFRRFQILKSTALGVGAPQSECLAVKPIRGYGDDTQVLYHTNSLAWYKERVSLPPPLTHPSLPVSLEPFESAPLPLSKRNQVQHHPQTTLAAPTAHISSVSILESQPQVPGRSHVYYPNGVSHDMSFPISRS
jgi:hypothetical protein